MLQKLIWIDCLPDNMLINQIAVYIGFKFMMSELRACRTDKPNPMTSNGHPQYNLLCLFTLKPYFGPTQTMGTGYSLLICVSVYLY